MSDNDVIHTPVRSSFDSPQKILKKIIYAPTAASDMQYDSLAHIDELMGGRVVEELGSLIPKNEYGYVDPARPDYPGMSESVIIRARIYEVVEDYKNEKNRDISKKGVGGGLGDSASSNKESPKKEGDPHKDKLDYLKKTPKKITKKMKDLLLQLGKKRNSQNPFQGLIKELLKKKTQTDKKAYQNENTIPTKPDATNDNMLI